MLNNYVQVGIIVRTNNATCINNSLLLKIWLISNFCRFRYSNVHSFADINMIYVDTDANTVLVSQVNTNVDISVV